MIILRTHYVTYTLYYTVIVTLSRSVDKVKTTEQQIQSANGADTFFFRNTFIEKVLKFTFTLKTVIFVWLGEGFVSLLTFSFIHSGQSFDQLFIFFSRSTAMMGEDHEIY